MKKWTGLQRLACFEAISLTLSYERSILIFFVVIVEYTVMNDREKNETLRDNCMLFFPLLGTQRVKTKAIIRRGHH